MSVTCFYINLSAVCLAGTVSTILLQPRESVVFFVS